MGEGCAAPQGGSRSLCIHGGARLQACEGANGGVRHWVMAHAFARLEAYATGGWHTHSHAWRRAPLVMENEFARGG